MSTLGKIFIVLNVVAAIVLATVAIGFVVQQKDLKTNLERAKQDNLKAVKALEVLRGALQARNTAYDKLMALNAADVDNKNNVITGLQGQLATSQGDKAKLAGDLSVLTNNVAGLKDSIEKINASKKELEEKYNQEVADRVALRKRSDEQESEFQNLRQEGLDAKALAKRLEVQLAEVNKANAYLKQHAQATLPETVPVLPTVTLHGVVKDADNGKKVAEINLGSSDQVVAGMVFEVSRGNKYLGDLKVTKVEENAAVGTLETVQGEIRRDDNVTYTVKHYSASTSGAGGVAVSGQPLSSVYTVLAIVATLFLVGALVVTMQKSNELFGFVMPLGNDYDVAKKAVSDEAKALQKQEDYVKETLTTFDLLTGMSGHTGAGEGGQPAAAPAAAPVVPAAPAAPVVPAAPAVPAATGTSAAPAA